MKKSFLASVAFLLIYSFLLGQNPPRVSTNYVNVLQQGFVIESLSGFGFSSSTYSPIFNIASGNPASMANFERFSAGFSNQASSKMEVLGFANITLQRINNFLPQSAGIVYPFKNFRIGAGYSQRYSAEIRFEDIAISDSLDYDGTNPEYFTAILKNTIHSVSTLASYQFDNLLLPEDLFSVGIQFNVNFLRDSETTPTGLFELQTDASNWKFGIEYVYHHKSIESLRLGVAYENNIHFSGYYESDRMLTIPPGAIGIVQVPAELTYPANLKFGISFEPTSTFGIYSDFIYNFWEDMYPAVPNKLNMSGGIVLNGSDMFSVSLGYYVLDSYSIDPFSEREDSESDAVYISGGLVFRYKLFDIHLVLADSHVFSGERSKQTIGKMGFGINL